MFGADAAASWGLIAWLPANSVERYVPDEHTLDVEKLAREVGAHGARHQVAAIKHAGDAASRPRAKWPTMLCHGNRFVEGIVAEDPRPPRRRARARRFRAVGHAGVRRRRGAGRRRRDPAGARGADRFTTLRSALTRWNLHEEKV